MPPVITSDCAEESGISWYKYVFALLKNTSLALCGGMLGRILFM
jgi:hypothetical protein